MTTATNNKLTKIPRYHNVIRHGKIRGQQRYGLTDEQVRLIKSKIKGGLFRFIRHSVGSRNVYEVNMFKRFITLVYDKKYQQIVTFLPRKSLDDIIKKVEVINETI